MEIKQHFYVTIRFGLVKISVWLRELWNLVKSNAYFFSDSFYFCLFLSVDGVYHNDRRSDAYSSTLTDLFTSTLKVSSVYIYAISFICLIHAISFICLHPR